MMICSKCTKFDQLFLIGKRKVVKIDAISCRDFHSKCTKMRLTAKLAGGAHSAPQTSYLD